jgi:uncharacterized protein
MAFNRMGTSFIVASIIFLAIIFVLVQSKTGMINSERAKVEVSGNTVKVEIADSPEEWSKGLMFRDSLEENQGMLFIFPDEKYRNFWMKNTFIPLDIIFISSDFEIIDVTTMQPCKQDICLSYKSQKPARYVLELNAGYAGEKQISIGDKINLLQNKP